VIAGYSGRVLRTTIPAIGLLALLLVACVSDPPDEVPRTEDGAWDLRVEMPEAPPASEGVLFEVPLMEVPPGAERIFCMYGTYTGETTGVNRLANAFPSEFHHHGLLKQGFRDDPPDGTIIDCTSAEAQWPPRTTLFERVGPNPDPNEWINLPDGVAFKLEEGQRWMADVHYVNTSDDPIVVNYGFLLGFTPLDDLRAIAGTFNMDAGNFEVPPGEDGVQSFDCAWHDDITVLSLGGHMHAFGTSYAIDHASGDTVSSVYSVPQWQSAYRFEPPMTNFSDGELMVLEGDEFATRCAWHNSLGVPLRFPEEMCTTFGVGYPLENNYYCDEGNVTFGGSATVRGHLRLDIDLPGDGVGDVNIFISETQPIPGIPPSAGQTLVIEDVELLQRGASLAFVLDDVAENEAPLFITSYLDDDGSGAQGGPTPGDAISLMSNVIIDGPGEFTFDIVFDLVMPEEP
jgi:hypothetical protein